MASRLLRASLLLLGCAASAAAQQGEMFGTVRDSSGHSIAGASVTLIAKRRSTTTDSLGRYHFAQLPNGNYTVLARKLGWAPETFDAKFTDAGRLEVNFTLRRRTDLDTVRVIAESRCPGGVIGFLCRRDASAGTHAMFLDYPDIDAYGWRYAVDLRKWVLEDRQRLWKSRFPKQQVRCFGEWIDDRPVDVTNPFPRLAIDIVGIELYPSLDSIPGERREKARATGQAQRGTGCGVILYWTTHASLGSTGK